MSENVYASLLAAAEYLLERHEKWMPNEDDWNALREAIRQARVHRAEENLVPLDCECPKCGERLMDRLTWLDNDRVRCQTCGTQYEPHAEKETADDHDA